jgi:hypothetical protein
MRLALGAQALQAWQIMTGPQNSLLEHGFSETPDEHCCQGVQGVKMLQPAVYAQLYQIPSMHAIWRRGPTTVSESTSNPVIISSLHHELATVSAAALSQESKQVDSCCHGVVQPQASDCFSRETSSK